MRNTTFLLLVTVMTMLAAAPAALATNGDNLIGIGPISRAMGGVGIAKPLDAISAVFANPAAMCFGDYCPASEMNFAGTLFMPDTKAKVTNVYAGEITAEADQNVYAIPAIGLSTPIGKGPKNWRFGLAAYGVSGLGVDYRGTALDNSTFYNFGPLGQFPLVSGDYTSLQIMKFAPALAFQPMPNLSLGLAVHVDYGMLDLGSGTSSGYAMGVEPGLIYNITDRLSLGLTYVSPQSISYDNVADFNGDGALDSLDLEAPQKFGLGLAYRFTQWNTILEADAKWLNWSNADGYGDFDWEDQWVFSVGAQVEPTSNLFLRAGYNYGKNPVNGHDNFNGMSPRTVQGKTMPAYYYETFRVIGFPAIVEQHLSVGVGYRFSESFSVDVGYMHAFEETFSQTGTDITGQPVQMESTLSEDSIDFGFTWRF